MAFTEQSPTSIDWDEKRSFLTQTTWDAGATVWDNGQTLWDATFISWGDQAPTSVTWNEI